MEFKITKDKIARGNKMLRFLSKIKEIYSPCLVCKSKTDQLGKGCTLRNVFICSHEKWDEKRVFVRNLQLSLCTVSS